jgi:dienelactone hydrolase
MERTTPIVRVGDCCTPDAHAPLARAQDSDLRGSFVQITEDVECYVAWPSGGRTPLGVAVLLSDIFGLRTGRHAEICDELAESGYLAICPDIFGDGRARANANIMPRWPVKSIANIVGLLCCCKLRWLLGPMLRRKHDLAVTAVRTSLQYVVRECERRSPSTPLPGCVAVGFCYGVKLVAHLLAVQVGARLPLSVTAGVGFHPSIHADAVGRDLIAQLARPLVLAPAGDDPEALHPSGELATAICGRFVRPSGKPMVCPFPRMLHGFMTRGPLAEPSIDAAYREGLDLTLELLGEFCSVSQVSCERRTTPTGAAGSANRSASRGRSRGSGPRGSCSRSSE